MPAQGEEDIPKGCFIEDEIENLIEEIVNDEFVPMEFLNIPSEDEESEDENDISFQSYIIEQMELVFEMATKLSIHSSKDDYEHVHNLIQRLYMRLDDHHIFHPELKEYLSALEHHIEIYAKLIAAAESREAVNGLVNEIVDDILNLLEEENGFDIKKSYAIIDEEQQDTSEVDM